MSLTVGDRTASARITERTPWGSYSVAGVGAPPFTVEPIELMTLSWRSDKFVPYRVDQAHHRRCRGL